MQQNSHRGSQGINCLSIVNAIETSMVDDCCLSTDRGTRARAGNNVHSLDYIDPATIKCAADIATKILNSLPTKERDKRCQTPEFSVADQDGADLFSQTLFLTCVRKLQALAAMQETEMRKLTNSTGIGDCSPQQQQMDAPDDKQSSRKNFHSREMVYAEISGEQLSPITRHSAAQVQQQHPGYQDRNSYQIESSEVRFESEPYIRPSEQELAARQILANSSALHQDAFPLICERHAEQRTRLPTRKVAWGRKRLQPQVTSSHRVIHAVSIESALLPMCAMCAIKEDAVYSAQDGDKPIIVVRNIDTCICATNILYSLAPNCWLCGDVCKCQSVGSDRRVACSYCELGRIESAILAALEDRRARLVSGQPLILAGVHHVLNCACGNERSTCQEMFRKCVGCGGIKTKAFQHFANDEVILHDLVMSVARKSKSKSMEQADDAKFIYVRPSSTQAWPNSTIGGGSASNENKACLARTVRGVSQHLDLSNSSMTGFEVAFKRDFGQTFEIEAYPSKHAKHDSGQTVVR